MNVNPIIVALDVETPERARELVSRIGGAVDFYKVGMELYAGAGMGFVDELIQMRKQVFLDLKFHDIGETVKRAVARVASTGVRFLTVHATNKVMRAAVEGKGGSSLQLLGVTVLTDLDAADLAEEGFECSVEELVDRRARNAVSLKVDGLVCSPLEVQRLRQLVNSETVLVTPGVRSAGSDVGDQKRVATPREALANGSSYLVIGRQITRAEDPGKAAESILREIS